MWCKPFLFLLDCKNFMLQDLHTGSEICEKLVLWMIRVRSAGSEQQAFFDGFWCPDGQYQGFIIRVIE